MRSRTWGLSILLGAFLCGRLEAAPPAIEITYVPPYGSTEKLRGRVRNVDPAGYHVAAYLFVEGLGWYVKPTDAAPCTAIAPNGDFEVVVASGGWDHLAHRYAVFLLPASESCKPTCSFPVVCFVNQCLPDFLPDPLPARPSDFAERPPSTVLFSGYTWVRRDSPYQGGPEGNCFAQDHAVVDGAGRLHLSLASGAPGVGCGGEVSLPRSLGYGEYRIHTVGEVDELDPQTVFGMFTWDPDFRPAHRELDVELGRWGVPGDPNAQFVVQPWCDNRDRFQLTPPGATELTFLVNWAPGEVTFSAYHGHHFGVPPVADLIHQRIFTSGVPTPGAERFRFNLWRYCGAGPCTQTPGQEVIVTFFGHVVQPHRFHTVEPCRLVDTREVVSPRGGPALPAQQERRFTLTRACGIPAAARAVSFNVTVTQPSAGGHLSLYPAGNPAPQTSTINYSATQTRANNAVVMVGDFGQMSVLCGQPTGSVHLIVDVNGYFE